MSGLFSRRHRTDAIQLVNVENGYVITQLTRAELERLRRIVGPDDLADKLGMFVAYLDGKQAARLRQRGDTTTKGAG
jgi:hypothetical protein